MPQLAKLETKTILLKDSEITCNIGLTYGDVCSIESAINSSMEVETGKDAKQKMNGAIISREKEMLLLKGLKSWDVEEEITLENIGMLTPQDGDFLHKELRAIYEVKTEDKDKKK